MMKLVDKIFGYLSTKERGAVSHPEIYSSVGAPSFNNFFMQNRGSYTFARGFQYNFDFRTQVNNHENKTLDLPIEEASYCAVDIETTGFNEKQDRITEISIIKMSPDGLTTHIEYLVNPLRTIPYKVSTLTGIYDDMLVDKQTFSQIAQNVLDFIGDSVLIAHHSDFDMRFINAELIRMGKTPVSNVVLCTCKLTRAFYPFMNSYSLDSVADLFKLKFVSRHRAYGDALMVSDIFKNFMPLFSNYSIYTIKDLLKYSQ